MSKTGGNAIEARYGAQFGAYCPGRLSGIDNAGFTDLFNAADSYLGTIYLPYQLPPTARVDSSAEYTCSAPTGPFGHAIELKLTVGAPDARPEVVARHCTEVNHAGSIAIGKQYDVEYHCEYHILASERGTKLMAIAAEAVRTNATIRAAASGFRTCLFASTDIQCSPCTSSDKLVVRTTYVALGAACPAGTMDP